MDYQVIPEKKVEDKVRKESMVIRIYLEANCLPAIRRALKTHSLYLQDPFDLDAGIPYHNFQLLEHVEMAHE